MFMRFFVSIGGLLHLLLQVLPDADDLIQRRLGQVGDSLLRALHVRFDGLHQLLDLLVCLLQSILELVLQLIGLLSGLRSGGLLQTRRSLAQLLRHLSDDVVDVPLVGLDLKVDRWRCEFQLSLPPRWCTSPWSLLAICWTLSAKALDWLLMISVTCLESGIWTPRVVVMLLMTFWATVESSSSWVFWTGGACVVTFLAMLAWTETFIKTEWSAR